MHDATSESPHPLAAILSRVTGPGQYVGGEPNQTVKPNATVRMALAFPDVYTVGMSHHGIRILYDIVNAMDGIAAERAFAPFPDMEQELRAHGGRLTTLETSVPLHACQVVGFSLGYELAATSVLTMLDLGGIPLLRKERENTAAPLVIAGGAAALNPEPLSDFIDVFLIGEGEESLPELLAIVREFTPLDPARRQELISRIAESVEGAYAPALYLTDEVHGEQIVTGPVSDRFPFPIRRRIVRDLDTAPQVMRPVVPIHQTVHERAVIEIMRGCPNGCRFCQAGYATRPLRERSPGSLIAAARSCIQQSGFDEVGLLSLSTSNYSRFDELVSHLDRDMAPLGVSFSLPSLRVDHALSGIPERFKTVRKSGLTVAPEAGTDRLRAVINKDVANDDLLTAAETAFASGWRQIKLYFMLGLPTETDDDARAISQLAEEVAKRRRGKGGGRPAVHLSVSNFVPKAFTAFQWYGAAHPDIWQVRQRLVADSINRRRVAFSGHDTATSLLEAVMARGDRRLGPVILSAWRKGARLDPWTEHFRPGIWNEAFAEHGLDPVAIAGRSLPLDARLPWDHIDSGVSVEFLRRQYAMAMAESRTAACGPDHCPGCGMDGCTFVRPAS